MDQQGIDVSPLLDATDLPEEFLRDPSYWMLAPEMEKFISDALKIIRLSSLENNSENYVQSVGHNSQELRSWGVLDSVLRMMPRPQEVFAQPERFLAYFISPKPPVDQVKHNEDGIEFDLPISSEQYPMTCAYLRAAFESLPTYAGQSLGICEWESIHFKITWSSSQDSFFTSEELGHSVSPELLRSVVASLEKHQRELEEKNRELQQRNEQLSKAQKEMELKIQTRPETSTAEITAVRTMDQIEENNIEALRQGLLRLQDYMVRAQQLVVMLAGQERMKPGIQMAMKRVDWEKIKHQFPQTVNESLKILSETLNNQRR